jgi:hypothetical protein
VSSLSGPALHDSAPPEDFDIADLTALCAPPVYRRSTGPPKQIVTLDAGPRSLRPAAALPNPDPPLESFQEPPKSSADTFQQSLSVSLDRSFDTFKRIVNRETSCAFRSTSGDLDSSLLDEFIGALSGEGSCMFSVPDLTVAKDKQILIATVHSVFRDGAAPARRLLQDAQAKVAQSREPTELSKSIGELRLSVKGVADAAIREMERERAESGRL